MENGFLLFQTPLFWTMELSLNDFMDSAPPFEASISSYEVRMDIPTDKAMLHWLIDKEYRNAFRTAANLDPTEYPKGWTDFFLNMTMTDRLEMCQDPGPDKLYSTLRSVFHSIQFNSILCSNWIELRLSKHMDPRFELNCLYSQFNSILCYI